MEMDGRVFILGEDILDPYGGAFRVMRGLSTAFPDRVLTTPISEAGIVGLAAGMALRGLRPVVEIMFGDFLTLAADQVINHIAKFRWMYAEQVSVPLVIRTPMGGRRSYGPTHSQTLEKLFLGIPGLKVLAPNPFSDPGDLLLQAILDDDDPVLFIENKLLYLLNLREPAAQREFTFQIDSTPAQQPHWSDSQPARGYPAVRMRLNDAPPPTLTIAAYGYMAELAQQAAIILAYQHEIFAELIIPTQLAPFNIRPILDSARQTRRLLVIEEGTQTMGWGAEIVALAAEILGEQLQQARRLGALDLPLPASPVLEQAVLPGVNEIVHIAKSMV
jgi:pyruvate/2-oxoglutarate/acetoin dehydrogenase E1 component